MRFYYILSQINAFYLIKNINVLDITLFNATPDGDDLFEIERLKNTYGYPCKKGRRFKVLYIETFGNKKNFACVKYQYKFDVDRNKNNIYLCIFIIDMMKYWNEKYLGHLII